MQRTAHPQDSTQNGSGNITPFGCLSATGFTDAHAQIMIRNQELPGPGAVLMGMEIHCQGTLALDYSSLEIDGSATTATSLSASFAGNMPVPVALLRATNLQITYTSNSWASIPLQVAYVHDGTSNLVLEVRKIVNPATAQFATMSTTSNPVRNDLPSMIYAFGGPGSGASTTPTGNISAPPLAVRLLWTNVPTLRLLSDPAASGNQFGLGGSITYTVDGTPGSLAVNFIGTSFLNPALTVPPIIGRWLVQGTTLSVLPLPLSGEAQLSLSIPNAVNLVGLYLTWQSGTIDAVTSLAQFTNGVDNFIRS